MRRICTFLLSILITGLPAFAQAQDPRGLIDLFQRQLQRQIEQQEQRRQQRDLERQHQQQQLLQQQQQQVLHGQFQQRWQDCHVLDRIDACDAALTYPYLNDVDRQRLLQKREQIVAEAERLEQQRRQDEARRQADLERQRQEQLELARAEAERARRQREAEEQRIAAMQKFSTALVECQRYAIAACDDAMSSTLVTPGDLDRLRAWKAAAVGYGQDREGCRLRDAAACQRALASPAGPANDRQTLLAWQRETSIWHRAGTAAFRTATATYEVLRANIIAIAGILAAFMAGAAVVAMRRPAMAPGQRAIAPAGIANLQDAGRLLNARAGHDASGPRHTEPGSPAELEPRRQTATQTAPHHPLAPQSPPTNQAVATSPQSPAPVHIAQVSSKPHTVLNTATGDAAQTPGAMLLAVFGNVGVFVVAYLLLMIPTYWLPYLGSNTTLFNTVAGAASQILPAFLLHLVALVLLVALAGIRGIRIEKRWLPIFPVLALVFDLTPGLSLVPLVPTVMHLAAIILGVAAPSGAAHVTQRP